MAVWLVGLADAHAQRPAGRRGKHVRPTAVFVRALEHQRGKREPSDDFDDNRPSALDAVERRRYGLHRGSLCTD